MCWIWQINTAGAAGTPPFWRDGFVIDREKGSHNRLTGGKLSKAKETAVCQSFADTISDAGYQPVVYASYAWIKSYIDTDSLEDCGIWIARYNNTTTSNAKRGEPYADTAYDYEFWQYSSVAKVSGYTGNLDVNFWYKDTSAKTGGLKATVGNAFDPVKLSWGKAADDVTGYRVYRYDEKQKKYVYMKQTSGKSFTDTDVTSGKTYQYRVRCFWTIGGTNYYGNYSSVVSATVPPAKVSDVKTQKRSSTYVTLGWSKISGSSGYRVYKYNTAEKKYESVATIAGGAEVSYKVTGLSGATTYKFKVKSYKKAEGETVWGEASDAHEECTNPLKVKNLRLQTKSCAVTLKWDKTSNVTGYQIYRYNSKTKKYDKIATIKNNKTFSYKDSKLKKVPFVGIIFYFFFGQNTRKERLISDRSMDQLTKRSMLEFVEQENLHLPDSNKPLMNLFANQSWALPFKDNQVDIYTDGYDFFLTLLYNIGQAKHHIHLDTYIFEADALGYLIADALIDKAEQGVEVRLIYDDVGCWKVQDEFFERMRDAGIDVHSFMPVRFPAFTSKVNYRNHRKLCVIDGKVGFIGGMNIALRYVKGDKKQAWRDTHLRIEGGGVYAIQRAFLVDWYFVDRTLVTNRQYYPPVSVHIHNNCLVQIVTSSPISPWPDIMQGYVRILLQARKYVYMETPYFLPTEPVLFAMRTAALAGVDIRLMLPRHADAKLVEWASRSYVMEAIEAGVKVYLYTAGFNHSKLLVSDDDLCTIGSTNIDFRSFENNFEANAFFFDEGMAQRVKAVYLRDEAKSILVDDVSYFVKRPFLQRLFESTVRLLSPLL